MRKHVQPADPAASIPDPAHGTDLPAEGRVVEWSVHWARMEARGDVTVSDVADDPAPEAEAAAKVEEPAADPAPAEVAQEPAPAETAADPAPATDPAPADGTVASVPFMITAANRRRLKALGKTDDEIANMKPEEAQAILAAADTPAS